MERLVLESRPEAGKSHIPDKPFRPRMARSRVVQTVRPFLIKG